MRMTGVLVVPFRGLVLSVCKEYGLSIEGEGWGALI